MYDNDYSMIPLITIILSLGDITKQSHDIPISNFLCSFTFQTIQGQYEEKSIHLNNIHY
jgi:hypothetical protein